MSGGPNLNRDGGYGGGGGGLGKLIIIIIVLLLGGGGGLGAFLGGSDSAGTGSISSTTTTSTVNTIGSMASLLLGSGYTSTAQSGNAKWSSDSNTGVLDDTVADGAREKYTVLKGDGGVVVGEQRLHLTVDFFRSRCFLLAHGIGQPLVIAYGKP